MVDPWSIAAILTKWGLYLGVLGAAGTVFCAALFQLERWRDLATGFVLLGALSAVLAFAVKGAALTGDAAGMTDPEMLGLLWTTQSGTSLLWQMLGLLIALAGLWLGRAGLFLSVPGALIAVWSLGVIGHIADRGSVLLSGCLVLHLICAALWIGILTPLKRLALDPGRLTDAARLGHRFGMIATIAVPLLLLAGGYMAYQLLGSIEAATGTAYGRVLLLKVCLVGLLLALAAANKLRFVPAMRRGDMQAACRLSRSISLEWLVVAVILLVTSVLTSSVSLPV